MDARDFAARCSEEFLRRLLQRFNRAMRAQTPDAVHQLRVATRRFMQAAQLLESGGKRKKVLRELRKVFTLAGETRDCDIAFQVVAKSKHPDAVRLQGRILARRKDAERALQSILKRSSSRDLDAKWKASLDSHDATVAPATPVEQAASTRLVRLSKIYFKRGDRACKDGGSTEDLHQLRIAAKKLRYSLELFAPVLGDLAGERIEQMKEVQTLLGGINDCCMVRSMVRGLGGCGPIEDKLKKRQRRKTEEFRALWSQEFSGGDAAARWMDAFGSDGGGEARKPMGTATAASQTRPGNGTASFSGETRTNGWGRPRAAASAHLHG